MKYLIFADPRPRQKKGAPRQLESKRTTPPCHPAARMQQCSTESTASTGVHKKRGQGRATRRAPIPKQKPPHHAISTARFMTKWMTIANYPAAPGLRLRATRCPRKPISKIVVRQCSCTRAPPKRLERPQKHLDKASKHAAVHDEMAYKDAREEYFWTPKESSRTVDKGDLQKTLWFLQTVPVCEVSERCSSGIPLRGSGFGSETIVIPPKRQRLFG